MEGKSGRQVENLFMNLKISERFLAPYQTQTIKDLRDIYKVRGFLDSKEMERLESLWRVAIMANGEVDDF